MRDIRKPVVSVPWCTQEFKISISTEIRRRLERIDSTALDRDVLEQRTF